MNVQTSNSVSLARIVSDVADTPEKLGGDLALAGIQPTGPMMFLYDGVTNDPHKEFNLRFAREVYQNFVEPTSEDNETRVQLGVVVG